MEDHIQRPQVRERIGYVVVHQLELRRLGQVGDVLLPTCAEIIDADDRRAGIEECVTQVRSHEPGAPKHDRSVKVPCHPAHVSTAPSAERCGQCLLCALAPDGLLVHSCGIGSDPVPGVAAAHALQAGSGELGAAIR